MSADVTGKTTPQARKQCGIGFNAHDLSTFQEVILCVVAVVHAYVINQQA